MLLKFLEKLYYAKIMKHKILMILYIISLNIATLLNAQTIDSLLLMSEEFPPYNFVQDGKLLGTSIDLMELCLQKMEVNLGKGDIQILPWSRSYKALLENRNTVLFAITRTESRENLFKWVGPISSSKNVLMAKKSNEIRLDTIEDIQQYRIGVVRDDAGEQLMNDVAHIPKEQLDIVSQAKFSVRQLNLGRIDLFAYDENVTKWILKQEGLDPADFETVYVLNEGFHYFGFHKETPDNIIQQFQNALDEIKEDGEYDKILARYLE